MEHPRQRFGQQLACALAAATTGDANAEPTLEILAGPGPVLGGLDDLALGDAVADTNIHGGSRQRKRILRASHVARRPSLARCRCKCKSLAFTQLSSRKRRFHGLRDPRMTAGSP